MTLRQYPKSVGALLAQTGLRRQRKNPTHGVVVGAANNGLSGDGASLAQSRGTRIPPFQPLSHGSALPTATLAAHRGHLAKTAHA
jgi:hypothetical protein